jgi:hypothetical protein
VSRVINPESAGKERTQILRSIVIALRELNHQTDIGDDTRDLAAYIGIALGLVDQSIDTSVTAWEKRGYWLKADRFRLDWEWAERLGKNMRQAVVNEDWPQVAITSAQLMVKVKNIEVPVRNRIGTPWQGAWEQLLKRPN